MRKIYSPNRYYEAGVQENPHHLVDLLCLDMFGSRTSAPNPRGEARSHVMGTTRISQLIKKGVKFVNTDAPGLNVSFEKGMMTINCHIICRNMDVYLRNLIAYEQHYLLVEKKASSYVVLMNYLIGTSEDAYALN